MATTEHVGLLTTKDSDGNKKLLYPITKIEAVDGLEEALANSSGDFLPTSGGTVTGTLVLSKAVDSAGDSYASPALVVGGQPTEYHLEFDNNEIQAKLSETSPGNLFLNSGGGKVSVGPGGIQTEATASIYPETALNGAVGTSDLPYNNIYGRYVNIYGGAGAQYARLRVGTTGTTSTAGTATLELGNATATGTAHNASGKITMYGAGTGFTNILPNSATSGSNSVTLPTCTGTLAVVEASTTDLTAGTSSLPTGKIYLVYE